ncbi:flagellar FlbD family protein [Euzebya sp.]|uniref:flagellar FlbD family protein n=1 Tax=Euzebya sp. TaxID=1971409 RepID=UPI0035194CD4
MIRLTRFNGQRFALNPDLMERIEATPDTVITLVDGTRHVVTEDIDEVIERVRYYRAGIVALSQMLAVQLADGVEAAPSTTDVTAPPLRLISQSGGDS